MNRQGNTDGQKPSWDKVVNYHWDCLKEYIKTHPNVKSFETFVYGKDGTKNHKNFEDYKESCIKYMIKNI